MFRDVSNREEVDLTVAMAPTRDLAEAYRTQSMTLRSARGVPAPVGCETGLRAGP